MQDYLSGYLQVLPEHQRKRIEDIIKDNDSLYNISSITEEEFRELMNRLAEEHQPLTSLAPQVDKLDDELHNTFFSNVHVDLNMLFLEEMLIESATTNYERIFDGIISDLAKETNTLRNRVESLRLTSEGEEGLIIEKRSFESPTEMEDRNVYSTFFLDRDGAPIKNVVFERKHDQYFIGLAKTKEIDCLRDSQNMPTATIKIEDRRGIPTSVDRPERYALGNAIDGNPESYWAEVVLSDEPINTGMVKG